MAVITLRIPLVDVEYFEVAEAIGEKLGLGRKADRLEIEGYTRSLLDEMIPGADEKNKPASTGSRRHRSPEKNIRDESATAPA